MATLLPRSLGLSILGGFGMMRYYFWLGVLVVYVGIAALIWEVCVEPELTKRSIWIQVVGIGLVFALFDLFTIGVVAARAPIAFYSYAMRKGDYPAGTVIGGITWDPHLTDLRVAVTNPSDDDYQDLDLAVQPDKWSYKAAIVTSPSGCDLTPIGGNTVFLARNGKGGSTTVTMTPIGTGFDAHDNQGNLYTSLATESGYRLRCGKFPAHFSVQIVFAVVTVRPDLLPKQSNFSGTYMTELTPTKSDFDLLDRRPSPSVVLMRGSFIRVLKRYSITGTINIKDGN
jgi:hypothetical protein